MAIPELIRIPKRELKGSSIPCGAIEWDHRNPEKGVESAVPVDVLDLPNSGNPEKGVERRRFVQ